MKKIVFCLFLMFSITLAIYAAGNQEGERGAEKQLNTFSVLYNDTKAKPFHEDWRILEAYEERRNVKLDVRLGDNNDYKRYIDKAMSQETPPDIILKVWPNQIEDFVNSELLLPFSDYEELMPHFQEYMHSRNLEAELNALRDKNGAYYILPGFQRKIQVQQWIYRKDLFQKHGLAEPETYEDLFHALKTLKEIYPDASPLSACWGGAHLFAMMGVGYGIEAGWNGSRHFDEELQQWRYSPAAPAYRNMLSFLHRSYAAGVLDPEIFSQSEADFYLKLTSGETFAAVTWISSGFSNWNQKLRDQGFEDADWEPLPVPESPVGIRALPPVNPFRKGLIVPSEKIQEAYFTDLIRFLDWAVYSEEGRNLSYWGIEGETYEMKNGRRQFLPDIRTNKNPDGTKDMKADYGFDMLFNLTEHEDFEDQKRPEEIAAFLRESLKRGDTAAMDPPFRLDESVTDAVQLIKENLSPYANNAQVKFITGEMSVENDWDAYLQELENRGYKTLELLWNKGLGD
ncbi:MAG: extracellular solute-binding protein [Spirochaetales bacterium]|nr:extracellular solute-binding protein [Spirochaetales bacterium]